MFTGLVQALGRLVSSAPSPSKGGATRLEIDLGEWPHRPEPGASIAVNGCCLTVVASEGTRIAFDAIPQTLAVTSLGRLAVGDGVNLEHAATPTTFLGGHLVLGHVDGLAEVVDLSTAGPSTDDLRTDGEWRVRLRLPEALGDHAVDKGSITLDGVSLTIARVEDTAAGTIIDVCLIPETLARTNLVARVPGDVVNVEVDYMSKLVQRHLARVGRGRA